MAFLRRKKSPAQGQLLVVHINAPMQPMHRGDVFEDPLDEHLRSLGLPASVTGGGTMLTAEGEPETCDIELNTTADDLDAVIRAVTSFLESRKVPRGSRIEDESGEVLATFGVTEGLALYLNGTDLPAEVYANSDVNELIDAIHEAMGRAGAMLSYWEGPRETALYLYGADAQEIRARLAPLLQARADTQLSRLVPLP